MSETTFRLFVLGWIALAAVVFAALLFRPAPYGRHVGNRRVAEVSPRHGWITMEAPAALGFGLWFLLAPGTPTAASVLFLCLYEAHYLYRSVLYPLLLPAGANPIPLGIALGGAAFNVVNASVQGYALFVLAPRPDAWLDDPRLALGVALFLAGAFIHVRSDRTLRALRRSGAGYQIPRGGLFRAVSCPNYLGEMIEWLGWAIATWSLAGLSFAIWTVANLAPRARLHHRWYRRTFADYPPERKALIPGIY